MDASTSTSSPAPSCRRRGSASRIATRCSATSAAGASRTCRRRPASISRPGGRASAPATPTATAALDLYVTNWGANVLFRNKGDGTFEDIAAQAGVAAGGWSTGCAFFDADADGDLDLYVARYVKTTWDEVVGAKRTLTWRNGPKIMVGPQGLPGEPDLFFENLGDGRFRDATAAAGLTDAAAAYGFGVVATDYDGDGRVDLFVANDSNPNFLYRNVTPPGGAPRFESVGLIAGVAVNGEARAQAGMGADAGDYDGDGRIDLALDGVRARSQHDLPQRRQRRLRGRERDGRPGDQHVHAHGLGDRVPRRRPRRPARFRRRQRPHLPRRRSLPRPRRDLRAGEPAPAQPGRHVPRRVGRHRPRPADAARQPRPRRRRPRRRRRSRCRPQQHGRAAGAAREPPAHRATTGSRSA